MKTMIPAIVAALTVTLSQPSFAAFGDLLKKLEQTLPSTVETDAQPTGNTTLDPATLSAGLKEALQLGSERAVAQLAAPDGFLANPAVHIPLPAVVDQSAILLRQFGLGTLVDQLETSMNRAAEQAVPAAAGQLRSAVEQMTIDDARRIYNGGDDAATRYFRQQRGEAIATEFRPLIRDAMNSVGVTRYYQQLVQQANQYPLIGNLNLDLEQHVTDAAVDGLFTTLAEQEALIRKDPAARSSELLKQVFGF
ncbi:DUF4197 domain-containing protein [Motiliproteus sediminis]|uniref:DUF4197 domain-containing protein n=1 Tax=Motiliproteus sediminis TaxID=1468178 RepID=UPI001AEFBBA2|nr:DUF4197 domain-containing protein [Motiliproteus sediminis]